MSDYGPRGYGSGSDDYGRDRYDGNRYDDYGDYAPRQRGDDYAGGYGGGGASGSASVRSSSPHDEPLTSGRARVPGSEPTGSGPARGSARVGGKRRPTRELSEEEASEQKKAKKKKKRRRRLIAAACVIVMLLGLGTVAGSIYFESVPLPEDILKALDQNTTITYSDGSPMAKIGSSISNRKDVHVPKHDGKATKNLDVPKEVKYALLATEDRKFYEHAGVDFTGVLRALWNNVTGGSTQGASTLTQQYVGTVENLREDHSYLRKAKEAVMAMKMDDKYSKDTIIEHYLNLVYMGRGAYGLGAAAEAWFKKPVKDLTVNEAALIFAQVKSPNGVYDPRDPLGMGKKKTTKWSTERVEYCLGGMLKEKWITKAQYDKAMKDPLPKTVTGTSGAANAGATEPTGFVSHKEVVKEAEAIYGISEQDIRTKGYTIQTTINKDLEKAAIEAASSKKGWMKDNAPKNNRAALVSVDPGSGEIVAYYGGSDDGTLADKAAGFHPPGSSFKQFTMITALADKKSPSNIKSIWDGETPRDFKERGDAGPVHNCCAEGKDENFPHISMTDFIRKSLNTPTYAMTNKYGANKVLKMARDMGLYDIQVPLKSDDNKVHTINLNDHKWDALLNDNANPRKLVDNEVGFGQYPVTMIGMAAANATTANGGTANRPHFIKKISNPDGSTVFKAGDKIQPKSVFSPAVAKDATYVLEKITPAESLHNGQGDYVDGDSNQQFAGKTGTWERYCGGDAKDCTSGQNSSTVYTGFTKHLAAAVWVGDKSNENANVTDAAGSPAFGAGQSGSVWLRFMEKATKLGKYADPSVFDKPVYHGDICNNDPKFDGQACDSSTGDTGDNGGDNGGGDNGGGDSSNSCDPTTDPNCGGGDTSSPQCDPNTDPNCGGDSTSCPIIGGCGGNGGGGGHRDSEGVENETPYNDARYGDVAPYATRSKPGFALNE
ncbi:MAG TPA: transglycosylase domain-containing protein [Stackebrandtia sp.]|uniref:transglycosylase domain-containing protein n=1 Tax=Stackebrandtia sp. TaxID=2023065 RepID=UPI002D75DA87|nr:transglycosylase domain-containing protein [Stackebrandtia sp.]HZE38872.1 transglycosylase domain-containing protein [Stackebrandtia sp.]